MKGSRLIQIVAVLAIIIVLAISLIPLKFVVNSVNTVVAPVTTTIISTNVIQSGYESAVTQPTTYTQSLLISSTGSYSGIIPAGSSCSVSYCGQNYSAIGLGDFFASAVGWIISITWSATNIVNTYVLNSSQMTQFRSGTLRSCMACQSYSSQGTLTFNVSAVGGYYFVIQNTQNQPISYTISGKEAIPRYFVSSTYVTSYVTVMSTGVSSFDSTKVVTETRTCTQNIIFHILGVGC